MAVISEHGSRVAGVRHAANIMNRIPDNQQTLLAQLRERDEQIVDALKDEMYEFFILSRQSPQTLQRIMDEVALDAWAIALKGTEPVLRQAIYSVLPKRQVTQLQSSTARLGPLPVSRIEQERKAIMATVRELAEQGEIDIQLFAERTLE